MDIKFNHLVLLLFISLLTFNSCTHQKKEPISPSEKSLLTINIAECEKHHFRLSEIADSIVFIELSPDYPLVGYVGDIFHDGMIIYDQYKPFKYFNRKGQLLGQIGREGQGPEEYPIGNSRVSRGPLHCFYDVNEDCFVVYSDVITQRGLRLRNYDRQGRYVDDVRLLHPQINDKSSFTSSTMNIAFSGGYYYLTSFPSTIKGEAVLCFNPKGELEFQMDFDPKRTISAYSLGNVRNLYRDHLLLWGYNDTVYEVRGKECIPSYRIEVPTEMQRQLTKEDYNNNYIGSIQPEQLALHAIVDTKQWLILEGTYKSVCKCYFYDKSKQILYGDELPQNDLGYFSLEYRFLDGYYYDSKKDEEWLYYTFKYGDTLLRSLEEADDLRSTAMRKELGEKESINPILVMIRLKK